MLINDKVDAVYIPDSPSRIKATDYNQIKNEIQECITEAGLTPTKDVIQLPQALKILTAQSGAEEVAKIEAAGQEQLDAVNAAGSTQTNAVNTAGETQTAAVNAAGQTQLNAINTAGAQAVQDAQTAANTATAKATEAAGSATEAAGSASAAASSASAASGSASTATTQATNASASAELAQKWATQTTAEVVSGQGYGAKYYADQAADSAESVVGDAEAAAASATAAAGSASAAAQSAQEAADNAASVDPDNLADKGLENTGRLTNCITKIPQDIKFELSSAGVLTLKAGSKAWYPNGKDSDGTLLFGSAVTANNISWTIPDNANYENLFVFLDGNRTAAAFRPADSTHSGSSDPGTTGTTYYNTSENYIDAHNNAGLDRGLTFPLAIVKVEAGKVTQIKQVFNGFGYIGQVLYALPGVEGLSPDGRNADGSLKNELMTLDHVVTRDYTWNCAYGQYVFFGISQEYGDDFALISTNLPGMYKQQSTPPDLDNYITWHRLDENKLYRTEDLSVTPNWVPMRGLPVGLVFNTGEGTNVSAWNIARPVAMLDMSNTSYLSKMGMPSDRYIDLTLGASGAAYMAPANGYFAISKYATAAGQYIGLYDPSNGLGVFNIAQNSTSVLELVLPIKKNKPMICNYSTAGTMQRFRFIYAEGDK